MKRFLLTIVVLHVAVTVATANTFTADGTVFEPTHGYTFNQDRLLVNDGSFEGGTCYNTPTWECTADNDCDWIADLVPLGLWNFDGNHVAWLGGLCYGWATCYMEICQDLIFPVSCIYITWVWMAYVVDAVMQVYISIDGDMVWQHDIQHSDHLLGYHWNSTYQVDLGSSGIHELCLGMNNPGCDGNLGDNYFVDYVEWWWGGTAVEDVSFSAVKSTY